MGLRVTETTFTAGGSSSRTTSDRKAKRTFIVEYDATTPPDSYADIETASDSNASIPAIASSLAGDTTRKATSISVKPRDQSGLLFDVEVEYSTSEGGSIEASPLDVPTDYEWDFSASSQPYFKDETSGTPQLTTSSAGEPFENLLEREVGEIVVTITKNITPASWDPIAAAQYMRPATAVNSDAITIDGVSVAIGQARFAGAKATATKTANGVSYRTLTVTIKLAESWDHVVDDRGFFEVDPDEAGKLIEIKSNDGERLERPWPLDGSGAAKANADDAPAELTFVPYPRRAFASWV